MRVALDELEIEPPKNAKGEAKGSLKTNVVFLQKLSRCRDVIEGNTTTDLIPRNPLLTTDEILKEVSDETAIALSLLRLTEGADDAVSQGSHLSSHGTGLWAVTAKREAIR